MLRIQHLTLAAAMSLSCVLSAQMSGTYTVNPSGSGPRNYTTFNSATYDLTQLGVNGPVTIEVAPGTYSGNWYIAPIPNASPTQGVTITSSAAGPARLSPNNSFNGKLLIQDAGTTNPCRFVTIDGIEFVGIPSLTLSGILSRGYVQDLEVLNCKFDTCTLDLPELKHAIGEGRDWSLHHSTFTKSFLHLNEMNALQIHHCDFESCDILIQFSAAAYRQTRIYNNVFRGTWRSHNNTHLAMVRLALSGRGRSILVDHNTFHLDSQSGGSCLDIPGDFGHPNEVRNNIFFHDGSGTIVRFNSTNPFALQTDHNIYWSTQNALPIYSSQTTNHYTLTSWQNTTGQGLNSKVTNPLFVNGRTSPIDLHIKPGSPASTNAGPTRSWIIDDIEETLRYPKTAIGAYEGEHPVTFTSFGQGCAGSGGFVPRIQTIGDRKLGSTNLTMTLTSANSTANTMAHLAIGLSNTSIGSIPLPFAFGGCDLLVAPAIMRTIPVGGLHGAGQGIATYPFPLPNDPKLIGTRIYFQWIVTDMVPGGTGLIFSNAGELQF